MCGADSSAVGSAVLSWFLVCSVTAPRGRRVAEAREAAKRKACAASEGAEAPRAWA